MELKICICGFGSIVKIISKQELNDLYEYFKNLDFIEFETYESTEYIVTIYQKYLNSDEYFKITERKYYNEKRELRKVEFYIDIYTQKY